MKSIKVQAIAIGITIFVFSSCKVTKTNTASYTYTKDVKTIIDMHCASKCHGTDRPAAGIDLTTFANVREQTLHGKLLPAIQHLEGAEAMPRMNPKLSDDEIARILAWANAGAPE